MREMRRLLVFMWLLGIGVWNAEAISTSGPVSNDEKYAQFWRVFPSLFPGEKFYLGEQGKQKALERGKPFEEVAKRYSEAESAEFGGRAGRLPSTALVSVSCPLGAENITQADGSIGRVVIKIN